MIVLFWSRATRDLLRSFGWGIAALHRLDAATKLPFPRRPPHSVYRSRVRKRVNSKSQAIRPRVGRTLSSGGRAPAGVRVGPGSMLGRDARAPTSEKTVSESIGNRSLRSCTRASSDLQILTWRHALVNLTAGRVRCAAAS